MQKSEPEIKAKALNRAFCCNPFSTKNAELALRSAAVGCHHDPRQVAFPKQNPFQPRHVGVVGYLGVVLWQYSEYEFRPVYATCFAYRRNVLDFHVRSLNICSRPSERRFFLASLVRNRPSGGSIIPKRTSSDGRVSSRFNSHSTRIRTCEALPFPLGRSLPEFLGFAVARLFVSTHHICPRARPPHTRIPLHIRSLSRTTADWYLFDLTGRRCRGILIVLQYDYVFCRSCGDVAVIMLEPYLRALNRTR